MAVLSYHTARSPETTIPLIEEVFYRVAETEPVPPAAILPRDPFRFAVTYEEALLHPEWLDSFRKMISIHWDKHSATITTDLGSYTYGMLEAYLYYYYRLKRELDVELLNTILDKAEKNNDQDLLRAYTFDIEAIAGYQSIPLQIALRALERLPHIRIEGAESVLVQTLSRIRPYDPDSVDNFMFEKELSYSTQAKVRAKAVEYLSYSISHRATNFLMNAYIIKPDIGQVNFIRTLFYLAAESESLSQWVARMLKYVLSDLNRIFTVG